MNAGQQAKTARQGGGEREPVGVGGGEGVPVLTEEGGGVDGVRTETTRPWPHGLWRRELKRSGTTVGERGRGKGGLMPPLIGCREEERPRGSSADGHQWRPFTGSHLLPTGHDFAGSK